MPVRFTDVHGCDGWIDDDLSLSYRGNPSIEGSIESCIDELETEGGPMDDHLESLVLELPLECNVREIERVDAGA